MNFAKVEGAVANWEWFMLAFLIGKLKQNLNATPHYSFSWQLIKCMGLEKTAYEKNFLHFAELALTISYSQSVKKDRAPLLRHSSGMESWVINTLVHFNFQFAFNFLWKGKYCYICSKRVILWSKWLFGSLKCLKFQNSEPTY